MSRFAILTWCLFVTIFINRKAKEGVAARKASDVAGEKSEPSSPSGSASPTSRKRKLGFGKVRFNHRI